MRSLAAAPLPSPPPSMGARGRPNGPPPWACPSLLRGSHFPALPRLAPLEAPPGQAGVRASATPTDDHGGGWDGAWQGGQVPWEEEEDEEEARAKQTIFRLLSYRMRTEAELMERLERKGVSAGAAEAAVRRVQELGMQSDLQYAELFARSKWRQAKWGPQRIRQALRQRGVGAGDAAVAVDTVFGDNADRVHVDENFEEDGAGEGGGETVTYAWEQGDELEGEDKGGGGAAAARAQGEELVGAARQQMERLARHDDETKRRRLVGWLQRRGHPWGTVKDVLREVGL